VVSKRIIPELVPQQLVSVVLNSNYPTPIGPYVLRQLMAENSNERQSASDPNF